MNIEYKINNSTLKDISCHLHAVDNSFAIPLSQRLDIEEYAQKLYLKSNRLEAWNKNDLVGLIAYYHNEAEHRFHVSNVSVIKQFEGHGIATHLLMQTRKNAEHLNVNRIDLLADVQVVNFYVRIGYFISKQCDDHSYEMSLTV